MSQDLPEDFETNKDTLWAASEEVFDEAEAKNIQESYKTKYPGEHAIIVPAHHLYLLMEEAGLIARDPLSIPGLWATKR